MAIRNDQTAEDGNQSSTLGPSSTGDTRCTVRIPRFTNPKVNLPLHTLCEIPNIVTDEEASDLVKSIDNQCHREWVPEGYDRRHRVQRFSSFDDDCNGVDDDKDSLENVFGWLFDRIASNSPAMKKLHRPLEVVVIEHTQTSCRSPVMTYEQNSFCSCRQKSNPVNDEQASTCGCYVAQMTLMYNTVQSIEKPLNRELECWDIAEPVEHHETQVVMEKNGVVVKTGDSLWNWRGRISEIRFDDDEIDASNNEPDHCEGMSKLELEKDRKKQWKKTKKQNTAHKRCIVVNFRGICQPEVTTPLTEPKMNIPRELKKSLPLSELLTIIVTTSPIRSHPSTEMLERTFETFQYAGDEFAFECPKVIICDGCRVIEEESDKEEKKDEAMPPKITRKYSNVKQTLRNGIATVDQANDYTEFKLRLRKLCEEANDPTQTKNPFRNARVVELEERHGYGFALRHALYHCVDTPYVCVIQHDRTFMRPTPVKEVVKSMVNDLEQKIKYVGVSQRSNLMYHDIFSGKYGRRAFDEFKEMILYPEDLCIGGNVYGACGTSLKDMVPPKNEKRRKILEALKETYRGSHQYLHYDKWLQDMGTEGKHNDDGFHQLSLSPTLFWYDNTHVVRTAHYRDFVFNPQYRMVARGGFVEDKLSPAMIRSCERLGLKDGHAKFGCYLLDDHSGAFFTGHLDGGSFMTADLHKNKPNDRYAAKMQQHGQDSATDL